MYYRLKNVAETRYHSWVREYVVEEVEGSFPEELTPGHFDHRGCYLVHKTREEAEAVAERANTSSRRAWNNFVNG